MQLESSFFWCLFPSCTFWILCHLLLQFTFAKFDCLIKRLQRLKQEWQKRLLLLTVLPLNYFMADTLPLFLHCGPYLTGRKHFAAVTLESRQRIRCIEKLNWETNAKASLRRQLRKFSVTALYVCQVSWLNNLEGGGMIWCNRGGWVALFAHHRAVVFEPSLYKRQNKYDIKCTSLLPCGGNLRNETAEALAMWSESRIF